MRTRERQSLHARVQAYEDQDEAALRSKLKQATHLSHVPISHLQDTAVKAA